MFKNMFKITTNLLIMPDNSAAKKKGGGGALARVTFTEI